MNKIIQKKIASFLAILMIVSFLPATTYANVGVGESFNQVMGNSISTTSEAAIDLKLEIKSVLTHLSNLPEFKDSSSDWNVMEMAAYGQKDKLTHTKTFLQNAITVAGSDPAKTPSTDFERIALSLTSMGYNVKNLDVGQGQTIDLIDTIANYKKDQNTPSLGTVFAYMYALMAYDSGEYDLAKDAYWTREVIIDYLIDTAQHNDGGWAWGPDKNDPSEADTTGMVISALTPYKDDMKVSAAIDQAINLLSTSYKKDGGYVSWGSANSNSAGMVMVALSGLGIDSGADERFIKDGISLAEHIFTFKTDDNRFGYDNTEYSDFATEQVFRGLIAYDKFLDLNAPYNIYAFGKRKTETTSEKEKITVIKDLETKVEITLESNLNNITQFEPTEDGEFKNAISPEIIATKKINGSNENVLSIEKGTKITASKDWDGKLQLPKLVDTPKVEGQNINLAIKVGSNVDLIFDKPVRLVIPNATGQKIGFIGADGVLKEITNTLESDTSEALRDNNDGKIEKGNDTIIWTRHFTTFVAYQGETTTVPTKISVSLEIKGDSQMGTIFNKGVEIEENKSAFDLLKTVTDENNISLEYTFGGSYIKEINGLREFDKGPNSGWKYKVNGTSPNLGAANKILSNGDHVVIYFVLDYTKEDHETLDGNTGSSDSSGGGITTSRLKLEDFIKRSDNKSLINIDTISTHINKITDLYKVKDEISQWEQLVLLLTGSKLLNQTEILSDIKESKGEIGLPTDRAKTALLLQLAGIDITNIDGINLLEKTYNAPDMGKQGLNGHIFSLMVMANGEVPESSIDKVIKTILDAQNKNGGFPLVSGKESNFDITAMALTALAPYNKRERVKLAIEKAIDFLISNQEDDGTFMQWDEKPSESISQIIIALAANGINPDDISFVKNNQTLMAVLLTYQNNDGSFSNTKAGESNMISTEQAMQALISYKRFFAKEAPIYVTTKNSVIITPEDLKQSKTTFPDQSEVSTWALESVNKAIALGIVGGDEKGMINPKDDITRVEFVKLLLAVMEEEPETTLSGLFTDVSQNAWYAYTIEKAAKLGLINGTDTGLFSPNQTISRQDMAVILTSAYNLEGTTPKVLDVTDISSYAVKSVASVIDNELMSGVGNNTFNPKGKVTREMAISVMIRILENIQSKVAA